MNSSIENALKNLVENGCKSIDRQEVCPFCGGWKGKHADFCSWAKLLFAIQVKDVQRQLAEMANDPDFILECPV